MCRCLVFLPNSPFLLYFTWIILLSTHFNLFVNISHNIESSPTHCQNYLPKTDRSHHSNTWEQQFGFFLLRGPSRSSLAWPFAVNSQAWVQTFSLALFLNVNSLLLVPLDCLKFVYAAAFFPLLSTVEEFYLPLLARQISKTRREVCLFESLQFWDPLSFFLCLPTSTLRVLELNLTSATSPCIYWLYLGRLFMHSLSLSFLFVDCGIVYLYLMVVMIKVICLKEPHWHNTWSESTWRIISCSCFTVLFMVKWGFCPGLPVLFVRSLSSLFFFVCVCLVYIFIF